jgi:hypothetical protein
MQIAVMQPYLFPYIGYFQLINAVDKFVFFDDVNYIKRGWINRNRILLNGRDHLFTLPLKKASQNKLIRETEISEDIPWQNSLLKTIEMCYKKAPFFDFVFPLIKKNIVEKEKNISIFIIKNIIELKKYLGITTEIVGTSSIYNNRNLASQDRIMDICKKEGANVYLNLKGGRKLYSKEIFAENGILLKFLNTENITYKQFKKEFVPNLSIIDVLMFNSTEMVKEYLEDYTLL